MTDTLLFSPLRIRGLTLKNRVVLSPMLTYQAEGGAVNDWHLAHLAKYAMGGVGLVFMESTKVDPLGCTTAADAGIWADEFVVPLRKLTESIHRYDSAAGIQLGHSGRKARNSRPWEGRRQLPEQIRVDRNEQWEIIGPSPIPHYSNGAVPRAMSKEDIHTQVEMWAAAARRADEAGFDVLEVHGAHGYLLHQFLSPASNQRTDEYGRDFEGRLRFSLEVVRRVRDNWPHTKPLFVRISAVDQGGWTLENSVELAKRFKAEGVDVVDCSAGGISGTSIVELDKVGFGYQVPYAAAIRRQADIPTMAVGLIVHARQAEGILRNGDADLVALGRELLSNPNWTLDAAIKLGVSQPYRTVPPSYGYWLEKRAVQGFDRNTSTWSDGSTLF